MQCLTTVVVALLAAGIAVAQPLSEVVVGQPVQGVGQPQGPVSSAPIQPTIVSQPVIDGVHQPEHAHHQQQQQQYYSPSGLISSAEPQPVVGSASKPGYEQAYGYPESQALPANYKPFGSWGLYIGGNPADGYYSNFYKSLSNSVEKQVASGEPVKPVAGGQSSAVSPSLRQAVGSSPYVAGNFYPFAYSPSELNSVQPQHTIVPASVSSSSAAVSPIHSGGVAHSHFNSASPSSYADISPSSLAYADSFATKKIGSQYVAQKEAAKGEASVQGPVKGHYPAVPAVRYVYQSPVVGYSAQPVAVQQQQQQQPAGVQQQQVVAYPVPVGSQIVGSQQGVDGAFAPYGVHAFTRYAVKPAAVAADQSYYYSFHSPVVQQFPAYKQVGSAYQPLSFYGYPLSQLHYSAGPVVGSQQQQQQPASVHPVVGEHQVVHHAEQHQGVVGAGVPVVGHSPVVMAAEVGGPEKAESKQDAQVAPKESPKRA